MAMKTIGEIDTFHTIRYDIDKGFLEVLENLLHVDIDNEYAKKILQKIMSNPLHKIFVAEEEKTIEMKRRLW